MNNLRALILDPDTCLQGPAERQIHNITLCPAASAEELKASVAAGEADLIMVDMELPQGVNGLALVAELRKKKSQIPAIVLTAKTPTDVEWMNAASAPFLQLVQTPITDSALLYHVTRLFPKTEQAGLLELFVKAVEWLRNEQGRLDANLVARGLVNRCVNSSSSGLA